MRMRRLRENPLSRDLIRENHIHKEDVIYPLFVVEGENRKKEIPAMPECYHFSVDRLEEELEELEKLGLRHIILFGVPDTKDAVASSAFDPEGVVQKAIRKIKSTNKNFYVVTDVCMCQYTDHGHCGIVDPCGHVLNDESLVYLSKIALSHAQAGVDMVAPSDMMDFRVKHIRQSLDAHGYESLPIMAYSAKFASAYYGPFRAAAGSAPKFSDRNGYQMDFANGKEALREIQLDIEEGADIIIVKPALAYMDLIWRAKEQFNIPVAAYNVSGEYAMLKHAIQQGIVQERVVWETLMGLKRAGADILITYFAKDVARELNRRFL